MYELANFESFVIAHKNVQLFITHGGQGGTVEAIYHKVPILGIPFFGDQDKNVAKATVDGWGRGMAIIGLNEDNFSEMLHDLLNNNT